MPQANCCTKCRKASPSRNLCQGSFRGPAVRQVPFFLPCRQVPFFSALPAGASACFLRPRPSPAILSLPGDICLRRCPEHFNRPVQLLPDQFRPDLLRSDQLRPAALSLSRPCPGPCPYCRGHILFSLPLAAGYATCYLMTVADCVLKENNVGACLKPSAQRAAPGRPRSRHRQQCHTGSSRPCRHAAPVSLVF